MASPVSKTNVSSPDVQPTHLPLSPAKIQSKITSIDALQIDLIGLQIIERVINHLGPVGKARVMLEVQKKSGAPEDPSLRQSLMHARVELKAGRGKFFSNQDDKARFIASALRPVTEGIAACFSTPSHFLSEGLFLPVSDYSPKGFLATTARETNIPITTDHIPTKYNVLLTLDQQLTQETSDLVFTLTEISEMVEFARETFTLNQLTEAFTSEIEFAREAPHS